MVDRVDKVTRSRIMKANRGRNTSPEIELRKALFKIGFRYRIHHNNLPGKPDIVLKKYRLAVFVHGCFWHGHNCKRHPKSKSHREFWEAKIAKNKQRDSVNKKELRRLGWRVLTVWECAIRRKKPSIARNPILNELEGWIKSSGELAIIGENGLKEEL